LKKNAVPTKNQSPITQNTTEQNEKLLKARQFAVPMVDPLRPEQMFTPTFYCRLCANPKHESDMIDLHANFCHDNETNIFQFLSSFLEISEEDAKKTMSICRACDFKLNDTLRFKAQCIKAMATINSECFDTVEPCTQYLQINHEEVKKRISYKYIYHVLYI
jgi:hypothetical protein